MVKDETRGIFEKCCKSVRKVRKLPGGHSLYLKGIILTTKKQKAEAGRLKREQRIAEKRASGLAAQKNDQENHKNKLRDGQREKHNKQHDWKVTDKNCILCQDRLEASRRQQSQ